MDWGMKNRLSRIIHPKTGKCVMLAVDHGYFQGPTTGLRNLGKTVNPLLPYADDYGNPVYYFLQSLLQTMLSQKLPFPLIAGAPLIIISFIDAATSSVVLSSAISNLCGNSLCSIAYILLFSIHTVW